MRITSVFNKIRFTFEWDYECELCGYTGTKDYGYDDRNYHLNVIPNMKCPQCDKSRNEIDLMTEEEIINLLHPSTNKEL